MPDLSSAKRPHEEVKDDNGAQSTSSKKAAIQEDGTVEECSQQQRQHQISASMTMLQFIALAGLKTIQPCDCSSLVKLNIPNCGLSSLPDKMPQFFPNLSILFAPNNKFNELPPVIGQCDQLQVRKKTKYIYNGACSLIIVATVVRLSDSPFYLCLLRCVH